MRLLAIVLGLMVAGALPAAAMGLDPAYPQPLHGPKASKGVIVWSHGRSLSGEDWQAPTPPYLAVLRDDGWDVMRFDRKREDDALDASAALLVDYIGRLKRQGYRRIVLAGQSYGGFLSLMAADQSPDIDAVIATAPAAYGQFDDDSDAWRRNATRLYPLLERVKRARVMVFYFHDDDFDPGGRGDRSRAILAGRGLGYAVIDQPFYLTGHWAAASGLFLRRFGACVRAFADDAGPAGEFACAPSWGRTPSAALKLPPELIARAATEAALPVGKGSGGSLAPPTGLAVDPGMIPAWYGFYPNGRETLLAIESEKGDAVSAVYAIGPSIDNRYPAGWSRRVGRKVGGEYVFDETGKNILRFRVRDNGGLAATWIAADGKSSLTAQMRPIDLATLAGAQPQ